MGFGCTPGAANTARAVSRGSFRARLERQRGIELCICPASSVQLCLGDIRAPEVGAVQGGAVQAGAAQVGTVQVGVAQVGAAQVGVEQVGAAQVGAVQLALLR
jgi:hypothetical protein